MWDHPPTGLSKRETAGRGEDQSDNPSSRPLQFGEKGRFVVKVANDLATRERSYRLLYDLYRETGIASSDASGMSYSLWNAAPETTTLFVEFEERTVGVLTVYHDSPLGLPADELYGDELNVMRRSGKRLCELGALGVTPGLPSAGKVVPRLFEASLLLAKDIRKRSHAVVECHPSHAHVYRDLLDFEQVGTEGSLERLNGAPVVLMTSDLDELESRHGDGMTAAAWSGGAFVDGSRTANRRRMMTRDLKRMLRPMSEGELRHFFIDEKPLLERATPEQTECVLACYPGYDLNSGGHRKQDSTKLDVGHH